MPRPLRGVAFGGGHGLSASLRGLLRCSGDLPLEITAIVTVGDDGGSSGRLRAERDALLPPGDLRQALAALASGEPAMQRTAKLLQYRFAPVGAADAKAGDSLVGHAVGNLLLLGLMEMLGDPVDALDHAAAMVGARGRVLPMARHKVGIEADVRDADPQRPGEVVTVRGQHAVAVAHGHVEAVRIKPVDPPTCPQAIGAISDADWLIIGPGSWYTSVLPHLLVPGLAEAITKSAARRLVTLNLAADNETLGLSASNNKGIVCVWRCASNVSWRMSNSSHACSPNPSITALSGCGSTLPMNRNRPSKYMSCSSQLRLWGGAMDRHKPRC